MMAKLKGLFDAAGPLGKVGLSKGSLLTTAGLGAASMFAPELAHLATGGYKQFSGQNANDFERSRELVRRGRYQQLRQQLEDERFARAKMENEMRLSQMDPHLYMELQVGRELPMGAVPIGGQQRRDLLDEVAGNMASGSYGPPPMQQGMGSGGSDMILGGM
jgi:hypothetical protein